MKTTKIEIANKFSRTKYYKTMEDLHNHNDFETLHKLWFDCFSHILKRFKVGFNNKSIHSLFYDFEMSNWNAMHKENTGYKDYSKEKLINAFVW